MQLSVAESITFLATRIRATMPGLARIQEFYSATTSINRYLERLEQYFVANSVPADSTESHKGRLIVISVIGVKAYHVLSDLCSPTPTSEKTYAQLTTILKKSFRTEETGYRRKIPQLYTTRRRECHSVRC